LTRHEIRLRGPFNPLPYSGLIEGCERFFEYLVSLRQSSLFFHPYYISDNRQAAEDLLAYRRDAVATILMNLYVLAGALRADRKVPVSIIIPQEFGLKISVTGPFPILHNKQAFASKSNLFSYQEIGQRIGE
jgi:hypothetical protein